MELVAEAQTDRKALNEAVEKERGERLQAFGKALEALLKEYNCVLVGKADISPEGKIVTSIGARAV